MDKRSERAPTLRDVARLAGVSVNTVSVILNERARAEHYAEETKVRVRETARQLGYSPNPLAQVLKRKRSNLIGVIVFTRESSFYTTILQSADAAILDGGFETVTADMARRYDRLTQCLNLVMAWRVEGIMAILGGHPLTYTALDGLHANGVPIVAVGPHREQAPFPTFNMDNYAAGQALGRHLIGLGHRRLAVLAGSREHDCSLARIAGLRNVLSEAGLNLPEEQIVWVKDCKFEVATGYHNAGKVLEMKPLPTALVCINDELALGAMSRIREHGLSIPSDISITGVDDGFLGDSSVEENRLGLHTAPPLTTVRIPLLEMGRTIANDLLRMIRREELERSSLFTYFPVKLIERGSTGPARV